VSFEQTYVYPGGRTSRNAYIIALVIALAVLGFYWVVSQKGLNGQWVRTTLLFPGFMLMARRLHDMGQTALLLLIPLALDVAAIGWHYANALKLHEGTPPQALVWTAVAVSAAFAVWGLIGKGQAEANRFGAAPA
jgi:uncharacterized membrane protein YhaH (DUF805 family)